MTINLAKDLERTYSDFQQDITVVTPQGQSVKAIGFIGEESIDDYSEGDSYGLVKGESIFYSPQKYDVGSTVNGMFRITKVLVDEGAYQHYLVKT